MKMIEAERCVVYEVRQDGIPTAVRVPKESTPNIVVNDSETLIMIVDSCGNTWGVFPIGTTVFISGVEI